MTVTVACVLRTPEFINHEAKQKKYSAEDVLKLKRGFELYSNVDHKFVCLTDIEIPGVNTVPLIGNTPGWWAKLELFRPDIFKGPVFYVDLDNAICNDISILIESCKGKKFLGLKDPKFGVFNSGLLYWDGDYSFLWDMYCKNTKEIQEKYRRKPKIGDQAFIEDNVKFEFFTDIPNIKDEWFCRIKPDTMPHKDTKFLICAGKGNKFHNESYINHPWVNKFWRNILCQ